MESTDSIDRIDGPAVPSCLDSLKGMEVGRRIRKLVTDAIPIGLRRGSGGRSLEREFEHELEQFRRRENC
jgi:hypothetical protein